VTSFAQASAPPEASNRWVHAGFAAFWLLSIAAFWGPLRQLALLALNDQEYTHILVIPCITAGLIFWARKSVFGTAAFHFRLGIPMAVVTAACAWPLSRVFPMTKEGYELSVAILAVLLVWGSGFLLCYGVSALRSARFPLLFLALMIPIPTAPMDKVIFALQTGSSELVFVLFKLFGVPFFRHGFTFELPGISIEVAKECSSIHSAWALFITGLLVGHFLLRSGAAKACLSLLTLPIAVLTNAMRIVIIWMLAVHVDVGFMYGDLHHRGGIAFSVISLSLLLFSLWILRKLEARGGSQGAGLASEIRADADAGQFRPTVPDPRK
jgi:exosortase